MLTRLLTFSLLTLISLNSFCQKDNTWLWKITKKGNKHPSYLFGTFHEAGNSVFDSFTNAKKFLIKSNNLLVESLDTTSDFQITQDDVNKGVQLWIKKLSITQQKTFFEYASKYNLAGYLAVPGSEIVINLHHDYISQFCSRWSSKDTLFIMDYQIELLAKRNNVNIMGLDDLINYNQKRMANITDSITTTDTSIINEMISLMSNILKDEKDKSPCKILDDYINGQTNYFFNSTPSNEYFSMTYRTSKWVDIIKNETKNNSCFIAVGFNHLRFREGLVQQLKRNGFKVKPVSMK